MIHFRFIRFFFQYNFAFRITTLMHLPITKLPKQQTRDFRKTKKNDPDARSEEGGKTWKEYNEKKIATCKLVSENLQLGKLEPGKSFSAVPYPVSHKLKPAWNWKPSSVLVLVWNDLGMNGLGGSSLTEIPRWETVLSKVICQHVRTSQRALPENMERLLIANGCRRRVEIRLANRKFVAKNKNSRSLGKALRLVQNNWISVETLELKMIWKRNFLICIWRRRVR